MRMINRTGIDARSDFFAKLLFCEPLDNSTSDEQGDDQRGSCGKCSADRDESNRLKPRRLVKLLEVVYEVVKHRGSEGRQIAAGISCFGAR